MRSSFPLNDVRHPRSGNHLLGVASSPGAKSSSFVLGPGYQDIENSQAPQALPGQPHDGSPAAFSSASLVVPQPTVVASSQAPAAPSGSLQASPSMESATSALDFNPSSAQTPVTTSSALTPSVGSLSLSSLLAPTSSGNMTATTLPISTSVAATSSSTIAPAADFATNSHGAPFWAGIALLGIACVATIITLLVWWLRVRKPTHRRPWESPWRWGRAESYKFPEDAITSGTSASWWKPQRDGGESGLSTSNLLSSRGMSNRELQLPVAAAIPFMHGPYPTVRPLPLELRHTDTSVPGLVQDVGSLHVANLVPGDILTSGDESSRPPTALDDIGTPREIGAMYKPRYLSLNGSGLDVPWIQTPPAEPTPVPVLAEPVSTPPFMGGTAPLNHNRWKERLERSSAMPTQSQEPPPSSTIEAWRDSLRINLANALNVFTSTAPPPVSSSRPSVTAYNWNHGAPAVARAPSVASTSSKPWTLEETCDGAGIVHIRGVPNPFAACSSSHSSVPSSSHSSRSRALPPTPSLSRLRPPPPPRASLVPPRLPHLPPMPAVPRTSVGRSTSTKPQHGSRSRRRASFVRRSSSSAASEATSVGSDMSRAGSGSTAVARWARLSEKEEAARRALRQRHRRSIRCARKRTHVSNELRE